MSCAQILPLELREQTELGDFFSQTTSNACPPYSWEVVSSLTLGLALFWFQDQLLHSCSTNV